MARKAKISLEERNRKKEQLKIDFEKRKKELNALTICDIEIRSMHEKDISLSDALALWKGDKHSIAQYLQNFVNYNRDSLAFLGLEYSLSTNDVKLILKASQLVGCAPLISPVTGKQLGNIIVKSEYQDDLDGIIPLIDGDIDLEYNTRLPLNNSPFVHPPIYLECIRFIEEFDKLDRTSWKKFSSLNQIQRQPSSSTDWGKYVLRSSDPMMRLKYPNRVNRLITEHNEWFELMYVLSIAINEIQQNSTPKSVQQNYINQLPQLKQLIPHNRISPVKELKIHSNDPINIQNLKAIGNNILKNQTTLACAWTFNIAKLYERYVQYIFGRVMHKMGGNIHCNNKYRITGQRPSWCLHYLEPDILLRYRNNEIIVDAKYKSHMMNLHTNTETLRDSFREDLHQVMAYSSLSKSKDKTIVFCYPCSSITHKTMLISSSFSSSQTKIYILGIPVNRTTTETTIEYIYTLLNSK